VVPLLHPLCLVAYVATLLESFMSLSGGLIQPKILEKQAAWLLLVPQPPFAFCLELSIQECL
jgi:hypothetical protein